MEGAGSAAHRRWGTSSSSQYSFRTSVSSAAEITGGDEMEARPPAPPVDNRVFVAVPEDVKHGKSTLLWALENLAKDGSGSGVVIAHVHCPAQMIPMSKTSLIPAPFGRFSDEFVSMNLNAATICISFGLLFLETRDIFSANDNKLVNNTFGQAKRTGQ